jgi:hypothetical protein
MQSNDLDPVRFSRLKLFSKSAAHFAHGYGGETSAMRKGTATHRYMLGDRNAVILYPGRRAGKKWEEFRDANEGSDILIQSEYKDVDGMRKAVERHPRAMQLLDGIREERIEWQLSGRACAGTPDVVHIRPDGSKVLVELKTSQSAAPDLFKWQAKKMAYHCQLAWYAQGLETTMAYAPGSVVEQYIVVVESTAPYPVTVVRVTDAMRRKGERQCRFWLEQLLVCERSGHFPGYVESDVDWDDSDVELEWDEDEEVAA